ncbi:ABC transporter ATP-binding protein [Anoxynatronum sibiricum]|uniref:ABC transporter ATP-binding protein n=1 Tax=Anoxynatronum sibiricum TaxID=210623 RepID=A0ABU9VWS5_9CLOT
MRGGFYSKFSREHDGAWQSSLLTRKNLRFYAQLVATQRKSLAIALVVTLLHTVMGLMPPLVAQQMIDHHILPGIPEGMLLWAILFFLLQGGAWFFAYHQRLLTQTIGQRAVADVRQQLFHQLLHLPMVFHEKQQKGALTSLVMNDVGALSAAVTDGIVGFISDTATLLLMIWIMYRLHPGLTLWLLATLPVVLLAMALLGRHIRQAFREVREKMAALNTQVEENFAGIRVVQSLGVQQQQEQDFLDVSEGNLQAGLKAMVLLALVFPLTSLTTGTGTALLLWYGGVQVMTETITLGIFVAFLTYLRKFYQPLRNLSDLYNTYLAALASLDRIMTVLETPNPLAVKDALSPLPEPLRGEVIFHQVSFAYDENQANVLDNLSLVLRPGERVGIAGATGAGKSTLAALLMRLRDPSTGSITLDGVPLPQIPPEQLHRFMAVVPQQVFLFSATVAENIAFGRPGASREAVEAAARQAMAHSMITSLPEGYDTRLGEEGAGLSGGQRQLIAFARALLKDAPLLVLDEATASMDVALESQVQASLSKLLENRSALIIAHRLSTLKQLDRICVIEKGKLAACGDHASLMKSSLYYRQLVESNVVSSRPTSAG